MKVLGLVLVATLVESGLGQATPDNFCGPADCIIPLQGLSCEELVEKFDFQGNCCALTSVLATGGCRITVAGAGGIGQCYWEPKEQCGACAKDSALQTSAQCNLVHESRSTSVCPADNFNALKPPSPAPSTADSTAPPTIAPTCAPISQPVPGATPEPGDAPTAAGSIRGWTTALLCVQLIVAAAHVF
jgi:hypothetical protein